MNKASELLKQVMLRLIPNLSEKQEEIGLMQAWGKEFAKEYAEHTEITHIDKQKIAIQVEHPAWLQRLNEDRKNILKTIHTKYPTLRSIRTIHGYIKRAR